MCVCVCLWVCLCVCLRVSGLRAARLQSVKWPVARSCDTLWVRRAPSRRDCVGLGAEWESACAQDVIWCLRYTGTRDRERTGSGSRNVGRRPCVCVCVCAFSSCALARSPLACASAGAVLFSRWLAAAATAQCAFDGGDAVKANGQARRLQKCVRCARSTSTKKFAFENANERTKQSERVERRTK